jgi:tetratricopeptide (TPR) repeat protein
LQKKYADAVKTFTATLAIDPEDLQAHYNLMLCYNGLGDDAKAEQHKVRYLRYKADESSQALTGPYRQAHPADNNERQLVHEHISVAFGNTAPAPGKKSGNTARAAKKTTSTGSSAGAGGGR